MRADPSAGPTTVDEPMQLDQRRNVGPDATRDHAAMREQLTARRDEAARNAQKEAQRRDQAETEMTRWQNERDHYDQMLRALGETAPGE